MVVVVVTGVNGAIGPDMTGGRNLAVKTESRRPITSTHVRTEIGLTRIDRLPGLSRWVADRFVELPDRKGP